MIEPIWYKGTIENWDEIDAERIQMDTYLADLRAERDALAARVKELENRPQGIGDGDIRKALDDRDRYREALEEIGFRTLHPNQHGDCPICAIVDRVIK